MCSVKFYKTFISICTYNTTLLLLTFVSNHHLMHISKYIPLIAEHIANIMNTTIQNVADITTNNAIQILIEIIIIITPTMYE